MFYPQQFGNLRIDNFSAAKIFGVILALLCLATGCHRSDPNRDARPRFAFVVNVPTDRFWDIAYAGCLKAASEENVTVEFHAPNEATAQQQKQIVESLMSRGIDGTAHGHVVVTIAENP